MLYIDLNLYYMNHENKNDNDDIWLIFDDFWWDVNEENLSSEDSEPIDNKIKYLKYWNLALFFVTIALGLFTVFWFLYYYIQFDSKKNYSFLNNICWIFIDSNSVLVDWNCSWYAYQKNKYEQKLNWLKNEIFKKQFYIYKNELEKASINNTEQVQFLLEKADTRVLPLEIISKFDDLRVKFLRDYSRSLEQDKFDNFNPVNSSIQCKNINIDYSYNFDVECIISWFWMKVISVASDFQREIDTNTDFKLSSKQNSFSLDSWSSDLTWATHSTTLNLSLKYVGDNYLEY